jgi:hypothetical protein|tara:strand:+ start:282 stop:434 length:153 start_codon:yes stop_codon:yes gene_type:complete
MKMTRDEFRTFTQGLELLEQEGAVPPFVVEHDSEEDTFEVKLISDNEPRF